MQALGKPIVKTNTQKYEHELETANTTLSKIEDVVAELPPGNQVAVSEFKHQVNGHTIACTYPGSKTHSKSVMVLDERIGG